MNTKIILERFSGGRLIERREQCSKSFVKQLWELFYIASAQINYTVPRSGVPDITGQLRDIDQIGYSNTLQWNKHTRGTLGLVAPHGKGGMFVPDGASMYHGSSGGYDSSYQISNFAAGENLGIVVGANATPVSPSDNALKKKICHGSRNAIGATAVIQSATTPDNSSNSIYDVYWVGLTFIVERGFRLSSVKLLLFRTGLPGTLTLCLSGVYPPASRAFMFPETIPMATVTTNGDTLPTAVPYEWREFPLAQPIELSPGIIYALYLKGTLTSTNRANLRYDNTASHQSKACLLSTYNAAADWSLQSNYLPMYELWGTAIDELEYSGCEIRNLSVANPNASFTISRDFTNNAGIVQVVRECGLYAAGTRSTAGSYSGQNFNSAVYSFCIARDVLSPEVTLNPGEVFRVTYVPQIAV